MKAEGFRAILATQGQEGALLSLAEKVEELAARVAALDTRPQGFTGGEEGKYPQPSPSRESPPPPAQATEPGREQK